MIKDTAPDEFYFNFGGYQGKFLLNHKRQWVVQCDRPIQVVFDDTYNRFLMWYEDEWIATSWYLIKIAIPNGEEITF